MNRREGTLVSVSYKINKSQKRSRFDKGEENKILVCYFSSISIKTQICIYIKAIVYRLDKCYC